MTYDIHLFICTILHTRTTCVYILHLRLPAYRLPGRVHNHVHTHDIIHYTFVLPTCGTVFWILLLYIYVALVCYEIKHVLFFWASFAFSNSFRPRSAALALSCTFVVMASKPSS